jgi:hypothetical protein
MDTPMHKNNPEEFLMASGKGSQPASFTHKVAILGFLLSAAAHAALADRRVTISPTYGPDIWFTVRSHNTDSLTVNGIISGLNPNSVITDDDYKQRFVGMDGTYRIIHTLGDEVERRIESRREVTIRRPVHDIIRFDLAGIFDSGPSDPLDLIPLYTDHPVGIGDTWTPQAAVKTPFGTGTAKYTFRVDMISQDSSRHTLARVSVSFTSSMTPSSAFKNGVTEADGSGWFLWDCTAHQRRETHLQGSYTLKIGSAVARHMLTINDSLVVHTGRQNF